MLKKRLAVLLLLIFLFLLGLAACGGGSEAPTDTSSEPEIQATQPLEYAPAEEALEEEAAAEEAAAEEVEEEMAEEAAEEEMAEEPAAETAEEPVEAVGSEDDGGSPFDPDEGPKVHETRTAGDGWVDETIADAGNIVRNSEPITATPTATAVAAAGGGGNVEGVSIKVGEDTAVVNTEPLADQGYLASLAYYVKERLRVDMSERQVIVVLDQNDRPLAGASVAIAADGGAEFIGLHTNSSGRVLFFPKAYPETAVAESFTLFIRYEGLERQATFSRSAAASEWTIKLDIVSTNGS